MFGETTRTHSALLPRIIIDYFKGLSDRNKPRKVVLVCDGLQSELRILDDLGVFLEDLPVTGVIDTSVLARDILGRTGSQKDLLNVLDIPWGENALHCAGNDAHYTMRILLALLQSRYKDGFERLGELARELLPSPLCWAKSEDTDEDDWDVHLGGDASTLFA